MTDLNCNTDEIEKLELDKISVGTPKAIIDAVRSLEVDENQHNDHQQHHDSA